MCAFTASPLGMTNVIVHMLRYVRAQKKKNTENTSKQSRNSVSAKHDNESKPACAVALLVELREETDRHETYFTFPQIAGKKLETNEKQLTSQSVRNWRACGADA